MKKEIYINESMGETRIAIIVDSQLVEVYIEKQDNPIDWPNNINKFFPPKELSGG